MSPPGSDATADPTADGGGTGSSLSDLLAGSLAGVAVVLVGQPLDTVKTKLQTFRGLYTGPVQCLAHTYRKSGLRGLYAGSSPAMVAGVAENSVLFASYGLCQRAVAAITGARDAKQMDAFSNAVAGCAASVFSSVVLCPAELVKIKLQAGRELAESRGQRFQGSVYRVTKDIMRHHGPGGLFRGLEMTVAREMPSYFCFFGVYEMVREALKPAGRTRADCGLLATTAAGAAGGVLLWTVTFPVDVVKSRIQLDDAMPTRGWTMCMFHVYRNEGVVALYSGLAPTLIRCVPSSAVLFLVYEYTKKLFEP
ncbi:mitochondrial ornithine transporter 1-like [Aphis gossypii]|uniref:mitochondrial ornithine transporter 1-like n=1 Tax=Aphis gossypii TaxID=80765 RepID=UPI00100FFE0E|nr:mitochondrial ornithine transporter 1-like [Aphis gossypii]